ncbi:MAG: hypothetical protein KAX55_15375, partial [Propionivibrio sp.]|nr:hypothetical protein [Propionivibrio sp.]
ISRALWCLCESFIMPEMAARPLHLCLPLQKIPREARLLQEALCSANFIGVTSPPLKLPDA